MDAACINYKDTGFFSHTITEYIEDAPALRPFYGYRPDLSGFTGFLKTKKVVADRQILVEVLTEQYSRLSGHADIESPLKGVRGLADDNTYTITTGHQLNIFAGPLYFIYKIVTGGQNR